MTEQERMEAAERFVRSVLCDVFHQKADARMVKEVAEKVLRAIPNTVQDRHAQKEQQ